MQQPHLHIPAVLVLGDLARRVPGDAGDAPLAWQREAPLQLNLDDVDARRMVHQVRADDRPAQCTLSGGCCAGRCKGWQTVWAAVWDACMGKAWPGQHVCSCIELRSSDVCMVSRYWLVNIHLPGDRICVTSRASCRNYSCWRILLTLS